MHVSTAGLMSAPLGIRSDWATGMSAVSRSAKIRNSNKVQLVFGWSVQHGQAGPEWLAQTSLRSCCILFGAGLLSLTWGPEGCSLELDPEHKPEQKRLNCRASEGCSAATAAFLIRQPVKRCTFNFARCWECVERTDVTQCYGGTFD